MSPSSPESSMIRVHRDGPILHVAMARPEQKNAFNPAMIAELTAVFRALGGRAAAESDAAVGAGDALLRDVAGHPAPLHAAHSSGAEADAGGRHFPRPRVVVLSGDGDVFSAGADLEWMRSMADYGFDANVADAERVADLFMAIRECPVPVVARVRGAAMGGGCGLVAVSDIAVAADDTLFAFSEARIGIVPAVISPFVLPKIGVAAARELFLTGERFGAAHAARIGLVARVVPEADLDAAVADRVAALLLAGPEAQAAIKRLIPFVAAAGDPEAVRVYTTTLIAERRASDEGREGMAAFLERRTARWVEAG